MDLITGLLNQYGYIVLYFALTLELIAFPTPGETLMTYCGFLSSQGELNWALSILVASLGIITGITTSYFIGFYFGAPFFEKHGSRIHLGPAKLQKAEKWFEKYGNGLLVIAYFVPGIRHVTGYFAGITRIPYRMFALNAYIGAFIWSAAFISLGNLLGANWEKYHGPIKKYFIILAITAGIVLFSVYLFINFKEKIKSAVSSGLKKAFLAFHSLGRLRLVFVGATVIILGFAVLTGGLIQDFLANEFSPFNEIVEYTVPLIFPSEMSGILSLFTRLSTNKALILICIFILIWIIMKGKNKFLEARIFIILAICSEFLEEGLRRLFHFLNPASSLGLSFPSEQSFLAIIFYGFAAFIVYRHISIKWAGIASIILSAFLCIASGLGIIYSGDQRPSDILAGYVFGILVLGIFIILLEIYRILLTDIEK